MKTKILIIVVLSTIILLGAVPGCSATDRYVPGVYPTIQQAVDVSSGADTIYVAAGTYTENVDIPGGLDGLRLIGAGKDVTTIEGVSGETIDTFSAVTIQGFTIRPAPSSATKGIRIEDDADGTEANPGIIRDNKIEDFTNGYGVGFATQTAQNEWWEILDNEFDNLKQGIYFEDSQNILVSGNTFSDCKAACAGIAGHDIQIVWNNFAGSTWCPNEAIGFCAEKPTELIIRHNTITGWEYGIRVYDCSCGGIDPSVQVHCNNIAGNNIYGIQNLDDEADLNATNNWWGAASGPSHSSGLGDKVSANVTFDPWLPFPFEQCPECGGVEAPAFSTLGIFSLIGLLSVVLAVAIWRKRE